MTTCNNITEYAYLKKSPVVAFPGAKNFSCSSTFGTNWKYYTEIPCSNTTSIVLCTDSPTINTIINRIETRDIVSRQEYNAVMALVAQRQAELLTKESELTKIRNDIATKTVLLDNMTAQFNLQKNDFDDRINRLNSDILSLQLEITTIEAENEAEKKRLAEEHAADMSKLRNDNQKDLNDLTIELNAAKELTIKTITDAYNVREKEYQDKLTNINNQINQLRILEEQRTRNLILSFNQERAEMESSLKREFSKQETELLNTINQMVTKHSSDIKQIRIINEQETNDLKREFQIMKQQSIDAISAEFKNREIEYKTKLSGVEGELKQLAITQEERTNALMTKLIKERTDMEIDLRNLYNQKQTELQNEITRIQDLNTKTINDLQTTNQANIKKLTNEYNATVAKNAADKAVLQQEFDQFKMEAESNIQKLIKERNDTEAFYKAEIDRLNKEIQNERNRAQQTLLNIRQELNQNIVKAEQENLSVINNMKSRVNEIIEAELDYYIQKKDNIDNDFELEVQKRRGNFDIIIAEQEQMYRKRIDRIQQESSRILEENMILTNKYKSALEETQNQYKILAEDYEKRREELLNTFKTSKTEIENALFTFIREYEDKRLKYIQEKENETQMEISTIANKTTNIRQEFEAKSEYYNDELVKLVSKLEDEKINKMNEYTTYIDSGLKSLEEKYDVEEELMQLKITHLKEVLAELESNVLSKINYYQDNQEKLIKDKELATAESLGVLSENVVSIKQELIAESEYELEKLTKVLNDLENLKIEKVMNYATKIDQAISLLQTKYNNEAAVFEARIQNYNIMIESLKKTIEKKKIEAESEMKLKESEYVNIIYILVGFILITTVIFAIFYR